jgi:hypothetical protein
MSAPEGWVGARFAVVFVCLTVLLASCGDSGGGQTGASIPSGPPDQATSTYGYGASRNAPVTYQPDVVVVEGGPGVIRSVSGNGLIWTIDGSASGASDLQVGKIMFATSRAVGRVVEIHDDGGNRVVTLAPVQLTDVVRDADIKLDRDLDPSSVSYQEVPDLPGALSQPSSSSTPAPSASPASTSAAPGAITLITLPTLRLAAAPHHATLAADAPALPPASPISKDFSLGNWTAKPRYSAGELGFGIEYKASLGLKAGIDFAFATSNLHITSEDSIHGGQTVKSGFLIEGIQGLTISLSAGAANGSADNDKVRIEFPIELTIPIPPQPATAGLPLQIVLTFNFLVETALTGQNSTVLATGKYTLSGPIGISGGKLQGPSFGVQQSIIDSLKGITLGPSGIVAAVKIKCLLGVGIPVLGESGPYGFLTISVGVTNGSSLGAPLARCKSATLDIEVGGGAELVIPDALRQALMLILPGVNLPTGTEVKISVLHRQQVVPDVPLCAGGG